MMVLYWSPQSYHFLARIKYPLWCHYFSSCHFFSLLYVYLNVLRQNIYYLFRRYIVPCWKLWHFANYWGHRVIEKGRCQRRVDKMEFSREKVFSSRKHIPRFLMLQVLLPGYRLWVMEELPIGHEEYRLKTYENCYLWREKCI